MSGIAMVGSVATLGLAGATGASAADTSAAAAAKNAAHSSPLMDDRAAGFKDYQGSQGFNLCLLSRCSIGSEGHTSGGIGLVQGGNLCLLASCELRP